MGQELGRPWRELQMEVRGRKRRWGLRRSQGQELGTARCWSLGVARHHGSPLLSHQEERVLSGALEASKAMLEEQLEVARERSARLHETQRENLLLRTRLGEAHAVS